jgi:hypothetical protein
LIKLYDELFEAQKKMDEAGGSVVKTGIYSDLSAILLNMKD